MIPLVEYVSGLKENKMMRYILPDVPTPVINAERALGL